MQSIYFLEYKKFGDIVNARTRWRFGSYLNGTRGPWRSSEEEAKEDGEIHQAILNRYYCRNESPRT